MPERRWPWLTASGLLLAAALVTAWSTYLHWLPCRGSMTNGSVLRGFDYGDGFGDACLRRMDSGLPFPYPPEPAEQTAWAAELGVVATVLLGLAWLTLVLGSGLTPRTKIIAELPGLLTLALAGLAARVVDQVDRSTDSSASLALWMLVEGLTVVALILIGLELPPMHRRTAAALLVVAWGTTAFGGFRQLFDYVAMGIFSDANWDVPPGMGYPTAAGIALAGILTLAYALRRPSAPGRADASRPLPDEAG